MINTVNHLAYTVKFGKKEIDFICRNIEKFYKEKKVEKKRTLDGTIIYRTIRPSQKRLKVLQKRVNKNILNNLSLPDYAYGAVKGKDNVLNAKKHQGKKYKLSTDLKDFFPFITNRDVFEMFRRHNFSPTVSRILTRLTTFKGNVPQGAPTSSSIANLVFQSTGEILDIFADNHGLTFTTFVDDITFSSPNDFKDKVPLILEKIRKRHRINHRKTTYSRNPNITGLHPMNNHLKFPEKFVLKLKTIEERSPLEQQGLNLYRKRVENFNKGLK